jgi:hypothetical protein
MFTTTRFFGVGVVAEVVATAIVGILVERWFSTAWMVVALYICLVAIGWHHWEEIKTQSFYSKASIWARENQKKAGCILGPLVLILASVPLCIHLRSQPKSVLTMQAHMVGVYGPATQFTQFDLKIDNPPDEAIQHVDLTISRDSKLNIRNISALWGNACKYEPINVFQNQIVTFEGEDGKSRINITTEDAAEDYMKHFGSPQWKLECQRLGGRTSLEFRLDVAGNAENDHVLVSGTYELIASEESKVVKVNRSIPIK